MPTRLCTHNEDVDAINTRELLALTGQLYKFTACDSDPTMSKQLETLCPALGCIELKVGAQVGFRRRGGRGRRGEWGVGGGGGGEEGRSEG